MSASSKRGNNPERWDALLSALDEKLQLGMLDRLKRVGSYHFEGDTLFLEAGDLADQEYLSKDVYLQQLKLLADDAVKTTAVTVKKIF